MEMKAPVELKCDCGGRKIPKNGFWVCVKCGDCGCEGNNNIHFDNSPQIVTEVKTKTYNPHSRLAKQLRESWITKEDDTIFKKIDRIIYSLKISEHLRKIIQEEILNSKPKTLVDILTVLFQTVKDNNYPITNTELREIAKSTKIGKEVLEKFPHISRDYQWQITQFLSNFKFLQGENLQPIFLKVKEYYDYISSRIQGFNPLACIKSLCYIIISKECKHINRKLRKFDLFDVSYDTKQKYKKMIDKLNAKTSN